jgi:hypothetical protein
VFLEDDMDIDGGEIWQEMEEQYFRKCQKCRWWSDKIARSIGCSELEAYCLNPKSGNFGKYTTEKSGCDEHETGKPVDA